MIFFRLCLGQSESSCTSDDKRKLFCAWDSSKSKCLTIRDAKNNVCCQKKPLEGCNDLMKGRCPEQYQVNFSLKKIWKKIYYKARFWFIFTNWRWFYESVLNFLSQWNLAKMGRQNWWVIHLTRRFWRVRKANISCWIHQFSSDHWSWSTLSLVGTRGTSILGWMEVPLVGTWMGDRLGTLGAVGCCTPFDQSFTFLFCNCVRPVDLFGKAWWSA